MLLSSSVVYAPFSAFAHSPFGETVVSRPMPPLSRSIASALGGYALAKLQHEEDLWKHSDRLCATALRLPYVIGRRDTTHRLAKLLLMQRADVVSLSPASQVPISFVDASSVAGAIMHIMKLGHTRRGVCGHAFNIAQPPASLSDILSAVSIAVGDGHRPKVALLPPTPAERVYDAVALTPILTLTLSTERIRSLGWEPSQSFAAAIAEAAHFANDHILQQNGSFNPERLAFSTK